MLGAIVGDVVDSASRFHLIKAKEFGIYSNRMEMTDDSLLTIGKVANSLFYLSKKSYIVATF